MYVRSWHISELPNTDKELDVWLRDRWTEKDQIINNLKAGHIEMEDLERDGISECTHYAFYCFLWAFICYTFFDIGWWLCVYVLVVSLFPVWIVFIEIDSRKIAAKERKASQEFHARNDEATTC